VGYGRNANQASACLLSFLKGKLKFKKQEIFKILVIQITNDSKMFSCLNNFGRLLKVTLNDMKESWKPF
jgi:hypothetical protein